MSSTPITRNQSHNLVFKRKRIPWPSPELSIGEDWCVMPGLIMSRKCWEAIGPAREIMNQIYTPIRNLLQQRNEYLQEGTSTPRAIIFSMYMIGRTAETANPTIVFSCENKEPRKRARKIIEESRLLNDYPGVILGDSSRPPVLSRPAVPLASHGLGGESQVSSISDLSMEHRTSIYYSPPIRHDDGISVSMRSATQEFRQATLGGFVCVGGKVFGLTVAHMLDDGPEVSPSDCDAMEFSIDYEDEEDEEDREGDDEDTGEITSQGD